jgi:cell division septation protein DedD
MEDKNELNDILIKNSDKEKGNSVKNILLFSAVTLLVFFIGVLAFKMISQDDAQKRDTTVLPEEPMSPVQESFEKEPVASASAEETLKTYKEILEKNREKNALEAPKEPTIDSVIDEKLPPKEMPEEAVKEKTPPTPPAEPEPVLSEPKAKAKPAMKEAKRYYIQVAALSKFEPNKKFLATITENKYKYKVVSKMINGSMIKRVYVGPFEDSLTAKKALPDVRDKISDKAFVIKD